MGGGRWSREQRKRASAVQADNQSITPMPAPSVEQVSVVSSLVEQKPDPTMPELEVLAEPPERTWHDTPVFLGIIGVFVIPVVIFVLQANGILSIRWYWSVCLYGIVSAVSAWAYLNWKVPSQWKPVIRMGVLVGCLVVLVGISATGVWKQYEADSWDGIKRREFLFKYASKPLTDLQQERITKQLSKFATYLEAIGLELPKGIPTIEIVTKQSAGASSDPGRPIYYDTIQIESKNIDDPKAATESYSAWAISRLVPISEIPAGARTLKEIVDGLAKAGLYRGRWIMSFYPYFSDSYWSRQRDFTKDMPLSKALWTIRSQCKPSPEFANRLAAFTVRAFADDNQKDYTTTTPEEYLLNKIRIADRIIDSESSQMPIIEEILKQYGILKPTMPPAGKLKTSGK